MEKIGRISLMEREGMTRSAWWLNRYVKRMQIQKTKCKKFEAWATSTEKEILSDGRKLSQYIVSLNPIAGSGRWDKVFSELMCSSCSLTSCTSCKSHPLEEKIHWWLKMPVDWGMDRDENSRTEFKRLQEEPEILSELLEELDYDE